MALNFTAFDENERKHLMAAAVAKVAGMDFDELKQTEPKYAGKLGEYAKLHGLEGKPTPAGTTIQALAEEGGRLLTKWNGHDKGYAAIVDGVVYAEKDPGAERKVPYAWRPVKPEENILQGSTSAELVTVEQFGAVIERGYQALEKAQDNIARLEVKQEAHRLEMLAMVWQRRDIQTMASILVAEAERKIGQSNPSKQGARNDLKLVARGQEVDISKPDLSKMRKAARLSEVEFGRLKTDARNTHTPLRRSTILAKVAKQEGKAAEVKSGKAELLTAIKRIVKRDDVRRVAVKFENGEGVVDNAFAGDNAEELLAAQNKPEAIDLDNVPHVVVVRDADAKHFERALEALNTLARLPQHIPSIRDHYSDEDQPATAALFGALGEVVDRQPDCEVLHKVVVHTASLARKRAGEIETALKRLGDDAEHDSAVAKLKAELHDVKEAMEVAGIKMLGQDRYVDDPKVKEAA